MFGFLEADAAISNFINQQWERPANKQQHQQQQQQQQNERVQVATRLSKQYE